jgi:hypothetical protein
MEGYEEKEGGICRPGCDEARDDEGAELEIHMKSVFWDVMVRWPTYEHA